MDSKNNTFVDTKILIVPAAFTARVLLTLLLLKISSAKKNVLKPQDQTIQPPDLNNLASKKARRIPKEPEASTDSPAAITRGQPTTTLLDLPLELREKIYTLSMSSSSSRIYFLNEIQLSKLNFRPYALPGICYVNKAPGQEATVAWIRRTRFVFPELRDYFVQADLTHWLAQFPDGVGLKAVRMLTFKDLRLSPRSAPCAVVAKFSVVRQVTIHLEHIDLWEIIDNTHGSGYHRVLKTAEELGKLFHQSPIFKVSAFNILRIVYDAGTIHHVIVDGVSKDVHEEELISNFQQMLEEGFAKNGRRVDTEMKLGGYYWKRQQCMTM